MVDVQPGPGVEDLRYHEFPPRFGGKNNQKVYLKPPLLCVWHVCFRAPLYIGILPEVAGNFKKNIEKHQIECTLDLQIPPKKMF